MILTRVVVLHRLQADFAAAGISGNGLIETTDDEGRPILMATDDEGRWIEPPDGAAAVIDAHDGTPDPPPPPPAVAALEQGKAAVGESAAFNAAQKTVLAGLFDGLIVALGGDTP